MDDLYYADYIQLDMILNSQHPRSFAKLEDHPSGVRVVVQTDHLRA